MAPPWMRSPGGGDANNASLSLASRGGVVGVVGRVVTRGVILLVLVLFLAYAPTSASASASASASLGIIPEETLGGGAAAAAAAAAAGGGPSL
ncbi:hypothetical protein NFJ02_04g118010 [Pycnococcus provasolii]